MKFAIQLVAGIAVFMATEYVVAGAVLGATHALLTSSAANTTKQPEPASDPARNSMEK